MIKRNFGRLKVKMWLYFFVFTVVVIGLVWIFQIIFTEGYYENEKTSSMKQLASTLSALAENEEGFSDAAGECAASGMSVYVVTLGAKEGDGVSLLFSTAKTNPDEIGGFFTEGIEKKLDYGGTEYVSIYKAAKKREDFLYLVRDVTYKGESAFMFLTSQYAELAEAASVLRLQYMTVAIIVVIIGFALSWYLSEKLS
ncbi:MAG: hypothetical protein IJS67_03930, partial [Clostridia bacterium]|nr:hypothetical protein [Clostridia bacterium]